MAADSAGAAHQKWSLADHVEARTLGPQLDRDDVVFLLAGPAVADAVGKLIDVVAGRVAAVKPQSAFFEAFGADGVRAWEDTIAHAHARGLLVVGEVPGYPVIGETTAVSGIEIV